MVHTDRNRVADLLKGMAVILMIQVHIMELFARQEIFENTVGKISLFLGGPPCAPAFMAVMGYFLFSRQKTFRYFLVRGSVLLVTGILLNIGLNAFLLIKYFKGEAAINPFEYIFGADILPLAGICIILTGVLRVFYKEKIILFLITAVAFAFFAPLLPADDANVPWLKYIYAFLWGSSSWSYFPVFPWYAYVLTGYVFRMAWEKYNLKKKFSLSHSTVFVIPVGIALVLTFSYAFNITYNLKGASGYYHHDLLFYAWVILFLIAWTMSAHLVEGYASNKLLPLYIRWIGRNVTWFYVIQWLIIGNVSVILYKTLGYKNLLLWFFIILSATTLIVYMIDLLRKKIV